MGIIFKTFIIIGIFAAMTAALAILSSSIDFSGLNNLIVAIFTQVAKLDGIINVSHLFNDIKIVLAAASICLTVILFAIVLKHLD